MVLLKNFRKDTQQPPLVYGMWGLYGYWRVQFFLVIFWNCITYFRNCFTYFILKILFFCDHKLVHCNVLPLNLLLILILYLVDEIKKKNVCNVPSLLVSMFTVSCKSQLVLPLVTLNTWFKRISLTFFRNS